MNRQKPALEPSDGKPAFELAGANIVLGRAPASSLVLDMAGVADQHARLMVDPTGGVWIEDLKTPGGTFKNGQPIQGKQRLVDGDRVEVGVATFVFRAGQKAPVAKVNNDQATMMAGELPQAVKDMLAKAQAAQAAKAAGGAQTVGTPEPEPPENRTVQMDAPDFNKLGLDLGPRNTKPGMPTQQPAANPQPDAYAATAYNQPAPQGFNPSQSSPARPYTPTPAAQPAVVIGQQQQQQQQVPIAQQATAYGTPQGFNPQQSPPISQQATAFLDAPQGYGQPQQPQYQPPPPQQSPPISQQATAFLDAPQGYNQPPQQQQQFGQPVQGQYQPPPAQPMGMQQRNTPAVGALQPVAGPPGNDVVRPQDKVMLVLAYLGILALVPFFLVKDSEYVKWHAKQGLALAIIFAVWTVTINILTMVMVRIIGFLGLIFSLVGLVASLGFLAVIVFSIIKAFKPERWKIPVASMVAEKLLKQTP